MNGTKSSFVLVLSVVVAAAASFLFVEGAAAQSDKACKNELRALNRATAANRTTFNRLQKAQNRFDGADQKVASTQAQYQGRISNMNARLTALESDLRSGDLSVGLWDLLGKNFMTAATCPKNMRGTCRKVLSTRVRIKGLERRRDTTMAQKVAKKDRMEVRSAEARVNHDNSSADYEAKKALYNACLSAS